MKTILVTLEYPPFKGGVGEYYWNMVENWPDSGSIEVIDNNEKQLVDDKLLFFKWRVAFKTLSSKVKKGEQVLVGNLLPLGTVAWLLSKIKKFDYSVFIHGTDISYAQKKLRKKWLTKLILKNAKNVICNSNFTASLVKEFLGPSTSSGQADKIRVVEPGVSPIEVNKGNIVEIKEKYNLENKKVLFSVGRLIKRKGVDSVIKLMPEILEKYNNVVYVVAGTGPDEDELKKLAINNDKIIFLGRVTDEEKWTWLSLCDIFVQPTRRDAGNFDGFGIVYLEANAMGKPVVAGRSGGVIDAVKDGVNGILVDPEKQDGIKKAILKLLENKELAEKLGRQGKERVEKDFKWKDQVEKIYNIFK